MIGSVVSHYRVIDRLGAGGMGVVYRAEDLRLGRHVAIKFLPEAATSDPLAVERFQREARTASALNHPNICTLHDVGEHEGRRYIVMELIDGTTLDRVLSSGPLPVDRVIELSSQVADALDAAHAEGILHRDIKPGNVFVTRRGQVKVVDFGLAKMMPQRVGAFAPAPVTVADSHLLTSAGTAVGTVAYMSPEHARGEALDQRSDLFSLGVVMYEMATGVQTFKGQTTAVIFDQILNRIPMPPSQLNPDVVPALEQVIGRLLEKDRQLRYQTARDLHSELLRLKRDIESKKVLTSASALSAISVSSAWAAQSVPPSADTQTVTAPTYGVDSPAVPVPVAWGGDWSADRGASGSRPGIPAADASAAPSVEERPEPAEVAEAGEPKPPIIHSRPATPVPAAQPTAVRRAAAPARPPVPWRTFAVGGGLLVTMLSGTGWFLFRGSVPASTSAAQDAPSPPSGAPAPETSGPSGTTPAASPVAAPAPAAAPAPPAAGASRPGAGAERPPAAPPTAARDAARPPTALPRSRPTVAPSPGLAAQAAALLATARQQIAGGNDAEGLATLNAIGASFAGTPAAYEALVLAAQVHEKAGRFGDAVEAWIAAGRAGGPADEASERLILVADRVARARTPDSDVVARRALGELLDRYPGSVRALRALQMKMALEDRLKLKEIDQEFTGDIPTSILTLRQVARTAGATPVAEFALWRLGHEYRDRRLHAQAAATFVDLGTRFPTTRYDAWFAAGEIYERQLRDEPRAKDAYSRVPQSSPKYDQAQRKIR